MKLKDSYHPYALITMIFWASAFVFTRLTLQFFSPLSLSFLRCLTASLSLVVIAIIIKIQLPKKVDIKWFILAGFFGFFFYMIIFNSGSVNVTAATASIIIATSPIITTLLARIFLKEKIRFFQYIAIIIEFIGVGVLTLWNGIFSINIGVLWLFLASISISIYNLLQRKLTKTYSSIQTTIIGIWLGTLMLFIFLPGSVQEVKTAPLVQILYILFLGIFPSALAHVTWTHAFSKAKNASSVSNYMFLTPFLTAIFGLFIYETLDPATIIGGIIIITGMVIFNFSSHIKIKPIFKAGLLFFLMGFLCISCAKKNQQGLTIKDGILTVGVEIGYPPMEYYDTDGKTPVGFDIDMTKALAERLGLGVEYIDVAWEGILAGLNTDKYDLAVNITILPERQKNFYFTKPYIDSSITIMALKNSYYKIERPEDIAGYSVGYQGNTTAQYFTDRLREQGVSFKSYSYDKIYNCLNDLILRRLDFVIVDNIVAFHYAGEESSPYEVIWQGPSDEFIGMCLKKGNDALTNALNAALDELFEDGTMRQISYKTFNRDLVSSVRKQ